MSKYEGMKDPKTKLPNGGGTLTEYSYHKGNMQVNSNTGTYKAGKLNGQFSVLLSE